MLLIINQKNFHLELTFDPDQLERLAKLSPLQGNTKFLALSMSLLIKRYQRDAISNFNLEFFKYPKQASFLFCMNKKIIISQ